MITAAAALLSTALGCGTISDAPHRSIATSAVLPAETLSDNPPVDEPQTDIPPLESVICADFAALSRNAGSFAAGNSYNPAPSTIIETGLASWYGAKHHGKRTASGEIFDQKKFTAAHGLLRGAAHVKVTNLDNGKSVEVRINDRGPFPKGRIIDLSRAAGKGSGHGENGS